MIISQTDIQIRKNSLEVLFSTLYIRNRIWPNQVNIVHAAWMLLKRIPFQIKTINYNIFYICELKPNLNYLVNSDNLLLILYVICIHECVMKHPEINKISHITFIKRTKRHISATEGTLSLVTCYQKRITLNCSWM